MIVVIVDEVDVVVVDDVLAVVVVVFIVDEVVMGEKIVNGERVPDTKTLKQVIDDVEDDGKIVDFLKDCPGIK